MDNNIFNTINRIMNSPTMQSIQRTHDKIAKMTQPVQDMQKHYSPIIALSQRFHNSIPKINPQVFEAVANLHSKIPTIDPILVTSIQKIAERFKQIDPVMLHILQNDSFQALIKNINNMQLDELSKEENNLFQTDIEECLEETDKKLLSEFLDVLQENMPGLKPIIDSFKAKNYPKTVIATILFIIFYAQAFLTAWAYFSENNDYRVNRENVRVRTTPSTVAKDNIITTLHLNIYVEKIDSDKSGWIKIRFEMSDGKIEEGWIYRTMLSKIE